MRGLLPRRRENRWKNHRDCVCFFFSVLDSDFFFLLWDISLVISPNKNSEAKKNHIYEFHRLIFYYHTTFSQDFLPEKCYTFSMYFVYILTCADGSLYTGSTHDLVKRLHAHNTSKSGAHYTKIRRPVSLYYSEVCETYAQARAREAQIKRMTRTEKQNLGKTY